jgi:transcriptional regulator with XRE-family HTH domain
MKTINSRLYEFITQDQGLTPIKFAKNIGVKEVIIFSLIGGEATKIDKETLAKIKKKYPLLNTVWLEKGTGEKFVAPAVKKKRDHWATIKPEEEKEMMKPIGERIVKLRETNGYIMEEVAKAIGIGMSGYSALEQGYAKISVPKLMKLKQFYNVSWDYLFDGRNVDPEKAKALDEANRIIKDQKDTIELLKQNNALLMEKTKKK